MERWAIQHEAGQGEVYARGAFDAHLGHKVPVTLGQCGHRIGEATLLRADIEDDGRRVSLLFEVPDGTIDTLGLGRRPDLDRLSIGFSVGSRPGPVSPFRRPKPPLPPSE